MLTKKSDSSHFKLKIETHSFLLIVSFILFVIYVFTDTSYIFLDLNIHDSHLVLSFAELVGILSIILGINGLFFWIFYWTKIPINQIFKYRISRYIVWLVAILLVGICVFNYLIDLNDISFEDYSSLRLIFLSFMSLLIVMLQIVLLFHFSDAAFKRLRKK